MNYQQQQTLIDRYGSATVIDTLQPYLTEQRQQKIDTVLAHRLSSIQLAVEAPSDINNALAAVRSSEVFGVSTVNLIQPEGEACHSRSISQGASYWTEVIYYDALSKFIEAKQQQGFYLAGGCVDATMPLAAVPIDRPLCILVGNEHRGLSAELLAECQYPYKIPMYGMTESLNLSVSAAISLFDLTQRKRQALNGSSDLSHDRYLQLKAQYYLHSVAPRLSENLLKRC